ncbi:MAG: hypothetical protein MI748_09200 [Opitutales bacterium]|nr:hypothetical protein [Opitutales bacterium]
MVPKSETAPTPVIPILRSLSEAGIVVALMFLLPYVIHLIPSWDDSPIGGKLLPIFYAPLIAAMTRKIQISIIASVVSPWINHFITGSPPLPIAAMLCIQLVPFSAIAFVLAKRFPHQFWVGPVAYLASKPFILLLFFLLPNWMPPVDPINHLLGTTINAIPGIIILAILSFLSHRTFPPSSHA